MCFDCPLRQSPPLTAFDDVIPYLTTAQRSRLSIKLSITSLIRTIRITHTTTSDQKTRNMPPVRQNFHQDCEAAINRQINLELYASYVYLSMAYYFDRDDQALHNFAKFFKNQSHEEREHAEKLMKVQNQRGGRIFLQDVKKPEKDEWGSGVEALESALQLEKSVNQSLLDLHKVCSEHNDPHMCDFIETHYLDEQVKSIKELGDWVTNLRRMGAPQNGMAEYLFDKHTLGKERE
ncbi:unnamed protein product [Oncorhynchus mykiss]|uniref:Ferritin n=2 Tax=Oncorhynchus mykiss TaxID=8022 RepID=A0A060YS81_ONCMY|nr:unnamed protein product [Oncorhynchus mykiss]